LSMTQRYGKKTIYGRALTNEMHMQTIRIVVAILALICSFTACGRDDTPEAQIRRYVEAGEKAAEARDIGDIKKLISEKYSDEHGRTRRDIVAVTARYFYSQKNIHILTRISELSFSDPDRAMLQLYVAMTGQDVSDLDALLNMRADLYRFDIELVREDKEWKLRTADWRRARSEDFF